MIRVKAMDLGFYDNRRWRKGDIFEIKNESEMGRWMKRMKPETKESEFLEEEEVISVKRGKPAAKKMEDDDEVI